jgi:protein-tyrosine-phosphatase
MHIGVICKANQARSLFAQSVLVRNFPNHDFFSSGVMARTNSNILPDVALVARDWEIPIIKSTSSHIRNDREQIFSSDYILCAEKIFEKDLRELGYEGLMSSFEDHLLDPTFLPVDPVGLKENKMMQELAKVAYASIRAVLELVEPPAIGSIKAVTPKSDSDSETAILHAQMDAKERNAILIDIDLRAPWRRHLAQFDLKPVGFEPTGMDLDIYLNLKEGSILTSTNELTRPESVFLNPKWRQALRSLARQRPIILLTAPRYLKTGRLSDSFLATIPADEISVVAS